MITKRQINFEYLKILKSLRMFKNFNHHIILNKLVIGEKNWERACYSCYILPVYLLCIIY